MPKEFSRAPSPFFESSAESEVFFDIGRHILAKKFAFPATEYKEIARGLLDKKILTEDEAELMRKMAGYRNWIAHFYHEITPQELHEICRDHLDEIKLLLDRMLQAISFLDPLVEGKRE